MVFQPRIAVMTAFSLTVYIAGYSKESLEFSETSVNVGTFVKGKPTNPL